MSYELDDTANGATIVRVFHRGVPIRESTCGTIQDAWRMCLGNLKSISEARSDSVRPDHTPVTAPEVRVSCLIEAPPSSIFDAMTDPTQVDGWTSGGVPDGKTRIEAQTSGEYSLGWTEGPDRILEITAGRLLVLRWPRHEGDLRLSFHLEEKASGTAVYLALTGYHDHEPGRVLRDRGRWSDLLVCLKNHVEGGDAGFRNAYPDQVHETRA